MFQYTVLEALVNSGAFFISVNQNFKNKLKIFYYCYCYSRICCMFAENKKQNDMTTIDKVENLIKYLKKSEDISVNVYNSKDEDWHYYYMLTGFLRGNYFAVSFNHHILSCESVSIEKTTDRKSEIKDILTEFDLL